MIQIRTIAFPIVLQQYAFTTLEQFCFQTKNLSTDGKQVYEIKCVKAFQPITTVINKDNKLKLPIFQCSPHRITVVLRLRRGFVERKIVDQQILLIQPIRSKIEQQQSCAKVDTFLHSLPHVLSFLHGLLLNVLLTTCKYESVGFPAHSWKVQWLWVAW